MKSLVFDASTVITLAMNNMLWLIKPLRKQFKGEFYVSDSVKKEILINPMKSKKFRLEAIQVKQILDAGDLKVRSFTDGIIEIEDLVNHLYKARGKWLRIMHAGEIGAMILARNIQADALVVDERTTRVLIENPDWLAEILSKKMHTPVKIHYGNMDKFKRWLGKLKVLRSVELGVAAYELGLLDIYKIENKKDVLYAYLWAVKLRGCSVSETEIDDVLKIV